MKSISSGCTSEHPLSKESIEFALSYVPNIDPQEYVMLPRLQKIDFQREVFFVFQMTLCSVLRKWNDLADEIRTQIFCVLGYGSEIKGDRYPATLMNRIADEVRENKKKIQDASPEDSSVDIFLFKRRKKQQDLLQALGQSESLSLQKQEGEATWKRKMNEGGGIFDEIARGIIRALRDLFNIPSPSRISYRYL